MQSSDRCSTMRSALQRVPQKNSLLNLPKTASLLKSFGNGSLNLFSLFRKNTKISIKRRFLMQMKKKRPLMPSGRKFQIIIWQNSKVVLKKKLTECSPKSLDGSTRLRMESTISRLRLNQKFQGLLRMLRGVSLRSLTESKANLMNCSLMSCRSLRGFRTELAQKSQICKRTCFQKSPICRPKLIQKSSICTIRLRRALMTSSAK